MGRARGASRAVPAGAGLRDGEIPPLSSSSRNPRANRALLGAFALASLAAAVAGCNPFYVARAGMAQARILAAREPIPRVIIDPATDARERGKLRLVWEARGYAQDELGFRDAGGSFTSLARLRSDTLALVLSAAYRDRLAFRTWWFPVAGRVPYRAFFSESSAHEARDALEADGFDTYLRPTAAFSTLGWFADPVYSSLLRQDEVGVVTTILHELAHNHMYLGGHGAFNESFANFAGHAGAIAFFCGRDGGGPDTRWCRRAHERWDDAREVSRYLMALEGEIRAVYARDDLESEAKIARRDEIYARARDDFRAVVQPRLRAGSYAYLADEELNNATLLARTLYFQRLDDFHHLWAETWDGDLPALMAWLRAEAPQRPDPFLVLEEGAAVSGSRSPSG